MFSPGQRVLAIPANMENEWRLGTVLGISATGASIGIEFDEHVSGHHCSRLNGRDGHCWWVHQEDIKELHEPDWYLENGEEDPCRPPSSLS